MGIKMESQEKKVNWVKPRDPRKPRKPSLSSLLLIFSVFFVIFFINGCARWPDGPDGGGQKLLVIRVDINENGKINTENGHYYIVFNTKENAESPPSQDIDDWEEGYYYIKLDNYGFCFGQWGSPCQPTSVGVKGEKYFQFNLDLDDLGNPEKIFMNIITTDNDDDETYDSIGNPSELTIDTSWTDYNKIVTDFSSDSTGGVDFDIIKVTTSLIMS